MSYCTLINSLLQGVSVYHSNLKYYTLKLRKAYYVAFFYYHMNISPVLVVLNEESNFTSSSVLTITYDLSNRVLGIVFKSRPNIIYLYAEVNILVYSQFLVSDSIGYAYNKLIKPSYIYTVQDSVDYIQLFTKTLLKI